MTERLSFLFAIFLGISLNLFAQSVSLNETKLPFAAGFKKVIWVDHSRQFKFKEQTQSVDRPIHLFIWYPAVKSKKANYMSFSEYVYASSLTIEASLLTDAEQAQMQKKLVAALEFFKVTSEQTAYMMKAKTRAIANADEKKGKFPLVVFGNVGDGFHFTTMAEFLAANGYIVASLPSLGANEEEPCGFDLNCLKLQQNDMEFVIEKFKKFPNVDVSKIGLIGWSFSGLTVAHLQTKKREVKAVVSLDAATGYQYGKEILAQSEEFDIEKTIVPFLHFHGLGGNSKVQKNFDFFNTYRSKEKRIVALKNLQHSDFASLYGNVVRYAKRENNKKTVSEIRQVNKMVLNFFNKYVVEGARSFLN